MLVWGGEAETPSLNPIAYNDGALYDPTQDSWQAISSNDAPSGRSGTAAMVPELLLFEYEVRFELRPIDA